MEDTGNQMLQAAQANSAIIAAVITGLITFVAGLLVNHQGKKQFFSTIVSKERMIWIREMRELCTELCTICELNESEEKISSKELEKFQKAKNGIILHLNSMQRKDQVKDFPIDKELYDMLNDKTFAEIKGKVSDIRENAALIFKTEWDKVKIEAGSSPIKIRRIKKIQKNINSYT